jgi:tRNA threonylcarbamoyladenosine biosynthesis protein TsaB
VILALNTSTPQFSLALLEADGTLLAESVMGPGGKQFSDLMPALDFLMKGSRFTPSQLDAVIVAKGPGSFTGLRVGMSTAKGLCQALGIPLIGVSSIEALASQLPWTDLEICAVVDSRRGEVFAGRFFWTDGRLARRSKEVCLSFENLADFVSERSLFIGNNFPSQHPLIQEALGTHVRLAPPSMWHLRASALGYAGLDRFHQNDFDDLGTLTPVYLRPPDVRTPRPHPLVKSSDQSSGFSNQ